MIHKIQDEFGRWLHKEEEIVKEAISFFISLYSAEYIDMAYECLDSIIPKLVTEQDNDKLEEILIFEQVDRVMFDMDGDNAAGLDGFTGKFCTTKWEIIGEDIYNAVVNFYYGAELPQYATSTSIVIIPKVENPKEFSQFCPISLCNFLNKIFSRILTDRLTVIYQRSFRLT